MTVRGILGLGRLRRIGVRFMLGATAALAIPVAMFTAPLPVSADAVANQLCEVNGSYCVNVPNFSLDTPVVEGLRGPAILPDSLGGYYQGYPTYLIRFNADLSKCVAAASDLKHVVIHACNGGTGVVWARVHISLSGYDRWINREASSNIGTPEFLSGHDQGGSQYFLAPAGTTGAYQLFVFRL